MVIACNAVSGNGAWEKLGSQTLEKMYFYQGRAKRSRNTEQKQTKNNEQTDKKLNIHSYVYSVLLLFLYTQLRVTIK